MDKGCRVMLFGKYSRLSIHSCRASCGYPMSVIVRQSFHNPLLHPHSAQIATAFAKPPFSPPPQPRPLGPRLLRRPSQPPARHSTLHNRHPPRPHDLSPPLDRLFHIRPSGVLPWRRHIRLLHISLPRARLQPDPARARRPRPRPAHQPHKQVPLLDRSGA